MTDEPIDVARTKNLERLPFGRILKSVMDERELTLKQVADLAGVRTSVVQDWREGSSPHDLKAVHRLARSLGMSFSGLLLGVPDEAKGIVSISELFDEVPFFDGLCRVSLKKLVRREEGP